METVDKIKIGKLLEEVALLLELHGKNQFRVRAYRNAARIVQRLQVDLAQLSADGELETLPGIGKGLAENIREVLDTGTLSLLEELRAGFPDGFLDLLKIQGLGPRKVRQLQEQLGISNIGELEYACQENRLLGLAGFGAKTQENVLAGIARFRQYQGHFLLPEVRIVADHMLRLLQGAGGSQVAIAGDLRRCLETIDSLDLVAVAADAAPLQEALCDSPEISRELDGEPGSSRFLLSNGLQIRLWCVPAEDFAFTLWQRTGSSEHLTQMRERASEVSLELRDAGLYRRDEKLSCASEEELYEHFGLPDIPPELREGRGEVALAAAGKLPHLIQPTDIKGIFHVHSTASDGTASLEELLAAARERGWKYLGICDHSKSAFYANGLDEKRVREQWKQIDALNASQGEVRLFKGIESDILADGSLDYADEILAEFDFVIASIHSSFRLSKEEQTQRLLTALDNPYVSILGHVSGRLLLARDPYPLDMEAVLEKVAQRGVVLELNANPHRLDIDWRWLRRVEELGIRIAINPDAHSIQGLDDVRFGIDCARKGGLTKDSVVNCLDLDQVWCQALAGKRN